MITSTDYQRIETAIRFLETRYQDQPSLDEVADIAGLSPYHFQRLFKRWAGVSPKRFLQYLTVNHARHALRDGSSVLDTTYETGLSGPGRLHDLFVAVDAMTPGEFKSGGAGLEIRYGVHETPFGNALIGVTERGVCGLEFVPDGEASLDRFRRHWPRARWDRDGEHTAAVIHRIFGNARERRPVTLLLRGTNFQLKVWEALLAIAPGTVTSYSDLAVAINRPRAERAVASAVAANLVAYLIPCHRVIRKDGTLGGYRWGVDRKRTMLAWEQARLTA